MRVLDLADRTPTAPRRIASTRPPVAHRRWPPSTSQTYPVDEPTPPHLRSGAGGQASVDSDGLLLKVVPLATRPSSLRRRRRRAPSRAARCGSRSSSQTLRRQRVPAGNCTSDTFRAWRHRTLRRAGPTACRRSAAAVISQETARAAAPLRWRVHDTGPRWGNRWPVNGAVPSEHGSPAPTVAPRIAVVVDHGGGITTRYAPVAASVPARDKTSTQVTSSGTSDRPGNFYRKPRASRDPRGRVAAASPAPPVEGSRTRLHGGHR